MMQKQTLRTYACIATALFLAVVIPAAPAAAQDDPSADVHEPGEYSMAVVGDGACAAMENVPVEIMGQYTLHTQGWEILIIEDEEPTFYTYDHFVWTWEDVEPECIASHIWAVRDANSSGVGVDEE